jgi:hypothetical protein
VARAHFDLKCAYMVPPQLFKLQRYENHVIEKGVDTNNNRPSQASLMIHITPIVKVVSEIKISKLSIISGEAFT